MAVEPAKSHSGIFLILFLGVQISTRVQLTLALISAAVVLTFFLKVIVELGSDNDVAKTFNPSTSTTDGPACFRRAIRGADLRRVRDRGQPRGGDGRAEAPDPRAVLISVWGSRHRLLPDRRVREVAGFGFDLKSSSARRPRRCSRWRRRRAPVGTGRRRSSGTDVIVVVLLDILAVGVGAAVASTRGVFAMARDRRLPAPLARVPPEYGTPSARSCS